MTQATFSAGQSVVVSTKGTIAKGTIVGIKGRWINVQFANGTTKNVGFKDVTPGKTAPRATVAPEDRKNGVVNAKYLGNYTKIKLDDGSVVRDNGDDAATLLRGAELGEIFKIVAHKLGVTQVSLHDKYDHLNPGQQRMNLGNRLRKALRDADKK